MNETQLTSAPIPPAIPLSMDAPKSRPLPVILLVEDEELVREVAADILEFEGYRVFRARNAHEAKAAFQRYAEIVQLLITDVVLPGQNGLDLARELKTASPSLRILFVSGFPENNWTRQAHREDESSYLPKPFSAESLMRAVRNALFDLKKIAI
jgi:two-component system, cell cycle sensor histidine kinase and response regulator CckA